jgi:hypothetical protein
MQFHGGSSLYQLNTNIEILESNSFFGQTGERTIFTIECIHGKSVVNHSYFKKKEDEVILIRGSYFEVIGQWPRKSIRSTLSFLWHSY